MRVDFPVPTFEPEGHRYTFEGVERPSVTGVLKGAGLVDATWFTEEAREMGSLVHLATQYLDTVGLDRDSIANAPAKFLKRIEAYERFRDTFRPSWVFIEQPLYDTELGIAGTFDRAGVLEAVNREVLVDFKAGVPLDWHPIQTAGYNRVVKARERASLYLRPDGTYKLHYHPNHAIDLARWLRAAARKNAA